MTQSWCDIRIVWPWTLTTSLFVYMCEQDALTVHYFVLSKNNDTYHFQLFPRVWMPPRLVPRLLVTIWQLQSSNRFLQSEIYGFTMSLPVDPNLRKVCRSLVFSVCCLPNPNHFPSGIRHIVFINAAKVYSGCARVGKVWSWHDDM